MKTEIEALKSKPTIVELYADNGALSGYELRDTDTGEIIWSEDDEWINPETSSLTKQLEEKAKYWEDMWDLKCKTVESLESQLSESKALVEEKDKSLKYCHDRMAQAYSQINTLTEDSRHWQECNTMHRTKLTEAEIQVMRLTEENKVQKETWQKEYDKLADAFIALELAHKQERENGSGNIAQLLSFELGYKSCERGDNLEMALNKFQLLSPQAKEETNLSNKSNSSNLFRCDDALLNNQRCSVQCDKCKEEGEGGFCRCVAERPTPLINGKFICVICNKPTPSH